MFSSATDLNQVRRHVVDLRRGTVETRRAFPHPDDREHFPLGLNILPPLQISPYLSEHDTSATPNLLRTCRDASTRPAGYAGGWLPQTMSARVFANFRRGRPDDNWPPRRLIPVPEFIERISSTYKTRSASTASTTRCGSTAPAMRSSLVVSWRRRSSCRARTAPEPPATATSWRWCGGPDHPDMEIWIWDAAQPLDNGPICTLGPGPHEQGIRPGSRSTALGWTCGGIDEWERPPYEVPTIEMPTYLKLLELGTIGAGVLRRLWQQGRPLTWSSGQLDLEAESEGQPSANRRPSIRLVPARPGRGAPVATAVEGPERRSCDACPRRTGFADARSAIARGGGRRRCSRGPGRG